MKKFSDTFEVAAIYGAITYIKKRGVIKFAVFFMNNA